MTYNIILVAAVQYNDLTLQNDHPALGSEQPPFTPHATTLPAASYFQISVPAGSPHSGPEKPVGSQSEKGMAGHRQA